MKTAKEKIAAVKRLEEGQSINAVSLQTGIDKGLLNVYQTEFRQKGEEAFQGRRRFTSQEKTEIVNKHIKDGIAITSLSVCYGIPAITIRRWIKAFVKKGQDGLRDLRKKEHVVPEQDKRIIIRAIDMTFRSFRTFGTPFGKTIPNVLEGHLAFKNPAFGSFLLYFYRALRYYLSCPDRTPPDGDRSFSEEELSAAYGTARMLFSTIPIDKRREAEVIIELKETSYFLSEFADSIPLAISLAEMDDVKSS